MYEIPKGQPQADVQAPAWDLAEQQGWNVHTILDLAMEFISQEEGWINDFVSFLQDRANEENASSS